MSTTYWKTVLSVVSFCVCLLGNAQTTITGKVADKVGPLPGASVIEKGTTNGTQTDFEGNFTLSVSSSNASLVVSYIGYKSKEIDLNGLTVVQVILEEDAQALDEVVILGFGRAQNKRTVSQSVATVSSEKIASLPISRPEAALQGTTPGVVVVQNSGSPGSPLTIRLRGTASPGNAQPLILLDGVQIPDMSFINPSDIGSITTLKDAAASAIYGARSANGVLLIESKKGRRNTDKIQVSVDGYTGFQERINTPELMNTAQYVQYYNEFQSAAGGTLIDASSIGQLPDTNWYDVLFDDSPMKSFLNASVMGGDQRSRYFISGSIFDQEGLIGGEADKSGFNRKTINLNFSTDLYENLSLRVGANLVRINRRRLPGENDDTVGAGNPFNQLGSLLPLFPVFDDAGNFYDVSAQNGPNSVNGISIPGINGPFNPLIPLEFSTIDDRTDNRFLNIGAAWEIVDDLTLDVGYGYYENITRTKVFQEAYDFRGGSVPNGLASLGNGNNQLDVTNFRNNTSQVNATLKYALNDLGAGHNLQFLTGVQFIEENGSISARQAQGLEKNTFAEANFAVVGDQSAIVTPFPDFEGQERILGFFGNVDYNFQEKYLFTASLRADSSSKFGPDNQTGYFPSFSAGWVTSEEDFFNASWINLFKLRGSWGITGIDNIPNDQFRQLFGINANSIIGGANATGYSQLFLPNPDVKWEETTQSNIGIDMNAFGNTLGITLDYYNNKTDDILLPVGVPSFAGLPAASRNIGEVTNKGFEALLTYRNSFDNGFSFNIGLNLAVNDNEVTNLAGTNPLTDGETLVFADPITITQEGESIASFFGLKTNGVDANGDLIFVDINSDGQINAEDRTIIGNPLPDFTYGINLGANFKGFDFSAFLFGSQGNDIFDATVRNDFAFSNRPASYLNNGVRNVLGNVAGSTLANVSDFYVKDGSFLKARTITLGYSLPEGVLESINMDKVRFYITGENLFVITDYDGADPEIGQANSLSSLDIGIDRGFFPSAKAIIFGFQFQF